MVTNTNANNIPAYRLHSKFVKNIMDSMILWYDLKRQGATNESMAQTPVLRDLSGNGHDATCYNFAWSGISGVGGFSYGKGYWRKTEPEGNRGYVYIFSTTYPSTGNRPEFSFTVKGITDLYNQDNSQYLSLKAYYQSGNTANIVMEHKITQDGHYSFRTDNLENFTYWSLGKNGYGNNSTKLIPFDIEVIEDTLYPHALVSDGVDDYAQVTGLPILTDYTIVAKRTDLSVIPDTVLASKRKQGVGTVDVSGAFQLERHFASNWTAFNFGSQNTINKSTDDIIYQTKSNYCGQNLSIGTAQDSDTMTLFKWSELSTVCANIALYSIMLFNRTLTAEEIEWVKTNLINNSPLFNVYSFRSANSRTQITYAVNDTLIINTTEEKGAWLVRGDINLLKTSFNITCNRPMFLSIADIGTDGNTVNKQKKYFDLQVGLNTVPAISDEDLSQYNELVICRPLDDTAGEYIIKAL